MKRNFLRILAAGAAIFVAFGSLSAAHLTGLTLFGVTWFGNQIVVINPMTGAATVLGSLGEGAFATGMGASGGRLFVFDQVTDRLREVNKVTGKLVSSIDIGVGDTNGEGALAFRTDGVGFLAVPLNANNQPVNDLYMFTIAANGTIGTSTRIGSTGIAIDGMAFNSQGTLYALAQDEAKIYTINTQTAAATVVGSITLGESALAKNSPIGGIAVAPADPQGLQEIYAAIDDRLFIVNPSTASARRASDDVINFGPNISSVSGLTFTSGAAAFGNLSARVAVGTGDNVGIGGFIIRGPGQKPVIFRGIGPSITSLPAGAVLADPVIELFNAQGQSMGRNNNWGDAPEAAQITARGLAPLRPNEAALLRTLGAGSYTAIVSGDNNTSGIGLVEIFDGDPGSGTSQLANLSGRGNVRTADQILIGGLIVSGSAPQRVVARAIGPDLAQAGVPNPLMDPMLVLRDANGTVVGMNDNFASANQMAELEQRQLTPRDPRDSAIILDLPAGSYTGLVTGVGGTMGIGLVEFFLANPTPQ
jgi:hypothetical protein